MSENEERRANRMAWWREARFGMFIHWGVYAVPAGTWKGERIPSLGEWIMRNGKIPIPEYEELAGQFNPVKFDAHEWVALAKRAGMKYIVITSKHHDGFCMFRSESNPYNILDMTPFGRDPMAELAEACRKEGIKLCFYHSQSQDWHAPGGAGHWEENDPAKGWHGYTRPPEDFARYLEDVVKPNVRELLTQYGPIGLIWFDTPVVITKAQSEELRDLVHDLQPDCLVSGRVGHDVGDYGSMGDNQIPVGRVRGDWETPATLNDTWGYKSHDHNWKTLGNLLYLLVDLASKGVNYLLNVGPTAEGLIPAPSIKLLEGIGEWMAVNGGAVYGTQASPYAYEFGWGRMTRKGNRLYLLITKWPAEPLTLVGLRSRVVSASLLADPGTEIGVTQCDEAGSCELTLTLPHQPPDPHVSVLRLDLDGAVDVDQAPLQQPDGSLTLPAHMAALTGDIGITRNGMTERWTSLEGCLTWQLKLRTPGRFRVEVLTAGNRHSGWRGGHVLTLSVGEATVSSELTEGRDSDSPRSQYHPEVVSVLGEIDIAGGGTLCATLSAQTIATQAALQVSEVRLVPAR